MASLTEVQAMKRALELARTGRGGTFPNPLVGAVVLDSLGQEVGTGFHACCGGPHAEVTALEQAGSAAAGGTLVVTLEPCCHQGRTGPCTDSIVRAGLGRVVVAMEDPDPRVSGGGIDRLLEAGIQVETGVLLEEASRMNRVYLNFLATGMSWLRLKLALSMDGRSAAADGSSKWLTCEESRREVHRMRASVDAVMTGGGTVRRDDPELTARDVDVPSGQPTRIVVTSTGDMGDSRKLFREGARVVAAVPETMPSDAKRSLEDLGADVWVLPAIQGGRLSLPGLLLRTAGEGIGEILCECGGGLATDLLREELVREISVFTAPLLLGSGGVPATGNIGIVTLDGAIRLREPRASIHGRDTLLEGEVVYGSC